MKKYMLPTTIIISVLLTAAASFFGGMWYSGVRVDAQIYDHDLLAKRIFLSKPSDTLVNFEPLRADLRNELAYYDGKVSLYFEYLPTGTSIRIGDAQHLVAASLLKVPVAMEVYKLAEAGAVNLDEKISLKKEWLDDGYGELYKKGVGYTLTIREFAVLMIENSDNTALKAVQSVVDAHKSSLKTGAYDALDVDYIDDERTNLSMTARSYASFLKCLYFACYVSTDASQEIMTYLTHSTYGGTGRIGEYIPDNVPIAHKMGVAGNEVQSDCGIIYVPNRNYLVCVMLNETKAKGEEVIAQVSKRIYDYITAQ